MKVCIFPGNLDFIIFQGLSVLLNFEEFFVLLAIYTCTSTEYTCSNEHSVITTPLSPARKLLWNIIFSIQDTMWRCAYYQEILISLVLGSFFPFEIRDFFFASKDKGIDTGVLSCEFYGMLCSLSNLFCVFMSTSTFPFNN